RGRIPEALVTARVALDLFKKLLDQFGEEAATFGNFPTLFMSLVADDGAWEHYGGKIRFVDHSGATIADGLDPTRYHEYIAEAAESWSYLKSPYYRPLGYPNGIYRVGPLARLNVCSAMGTPQGDKELHEYRQRSGVAANSSFF